MLFWYNLLEQRMMFPPLRELGQHRSPTLHCGSSLWQTTRGHQGCSLVQRHGSWEDWENHIQWKCADQHCHLQPLAHGTCGTAASLTHQIQLLKFNPRSAGLIKGLLQPIFKEDLSLKGGNKVLSTAIIWQINCKREINQQGILSWKSSVGCISYNLTICTRRTTQLVTQYSLTELETSPLFGSERRSYRLARNSMLIFTLSSNLVQWLQHCPLLWFETYKNLTLFGMDFLLKP